MSPIFTQSWTTLPCAGVTVWHAIVEEGQVKAGDTVVVLGSGGVSLFARRERIEAMNRAISRHALRPVVDRVFPFSQSVDALRHLQNVSYFGKIAIRFDQNAASAG